MIVPYTLTIDVTNAFVNCFQCLLLIPRSPFLLIILDTRYRFSGYLSPRPQNDRSNQTNRSPSLTVASSFRDVLLSTSLGRVGPPLAFFIDSFAPCPRPESRWQPSSPMEHVSPHSASLTNQHVHARLRHRDPQSFGSQERIITRYPDV